MLYLNALRPRAELPVPVVLACKTLRPTAVLFETVLHNNAKVPTAVLLIPVVLAYNAKVVEKQVFENLLITPDVICFPENINYCLLFAKQEKISTFNIKNNFESLFDK